MENDRLRTAGTVGFLSGVINAILTLNESPLAGVIILAFAGVTFGIVTGIYFVRSSGCSSKYLRLAAWIAASFVSYFIAIRVALPHVETTSPTAIHFAYGGFIGALTLGIAFHFIFNKFDIRQTIKLVAIGAITAFFVGLLFPSSGSPAFFLATMYICWQTLVTVMLGSLLPDAVNTNIQEITVPTNGLPSR